MLEFKRYPVKSERLKHWIKFFWSLETTDTVTVKHKLLPTESIDLIISVKNQTTYEMDGKQYGAENVHFCGLREKPRVIIQNGALRVFGISFYSFGLFPFITEALDPFRRAVVGLNSCNSVLSTQLESIYNKGLSAESTVTAMSDALEAVLRISDTELSRTAHIKNFCDNYSEKSVGQFCQETGIHLRSFERSCLKYTGCTPSALKRIIRFQAVSNQMIYSRDKDSFADLAYAYNYYDQAHFIRNFQTYADASPRQFVKEGLSVKQNGKVVIIK